MNSIRTLNQSARFNRLMLMLGILVLAGGALALVVKVAGSSSGDTNQKLTASKAKPPAQSKPLDNDTGARIRTYSQLDPGMKQTIRTFLRSAVARKDQADSWAVVTPNMRQGYTRKQWSTSDALPIVPYPIDSIDRVSYALDYATNQEIMLDVGVAAKPELKLRAVTFMLALAPVGDGANKRWLVDYWMPRWSPPVPAQ
ncbi:MAG TPA: hypothetical protein VH297_10110 [Gaiellaceae bacterium]